MDRSTDRTVLVTGAGGRCRPGSSGAHSRNHRALSGPSALRKDIAEPGEHTSDLRRRQWGDRGSNPGPRDYESPALTG